MKNLIIILSLITLITSCKKNPTAKTISHYPNRIEFSKYENTILLDFNSFDNFNELVDSLENLKYLGKISTFQLKKGKTKYQFIAKTTFGNCSAPPMLKFKNIISLSSDSILNTNYYIIDSLKSVLKRNLLNFGSIDSLSDSPKRLMISITAEISELEPLLLKLFGAYDEIKSGSRDSLQLNIFFNRRLEIFPPVPKLPKIESTK
ncbi:MAG: hypothetical protein QM478_12815 [Flavobacteriaceae bacterium]